MAPFTIGQVADRSGFTASALRYYEHVGLVRPSSRTAAGYRVYDDATLRRLAFIARAKQLGCSLDEIADLVAIWDGESCEPVQRRFHTLVTEKIATTQRQIAELTAFGTQLQTAAAHLHTDPVDGPCNDDCACVTEPSEAVPVVLGTRPADAPIVCTLPGGAMPDRILEWQTVLDAARQRSATDDGALRIEFNGDVDVAELARLVGSEQECCSFFAFALTVDGRGTALEVRAPDGAAEIVSVMFGVAS